MKRLARWFAGAYLLVLLGVVATFRLVGESWWVVTALLYLPRWIFLLPALLVLLALCLARDVRGVSVCALALGLVTLPLLGVSLRATVVAHSRAGKQSLRVFSYNVARGKHHRHLAAAIRAADADLLLFQEWTPALNASIQALLPSHQRAVVDQFAFFSRHPIVATEGTPAELPESPDGRAFASATVASPLGEIVVFNVHPVSPRRGFERLRHDAWSEEARRSVDAESRMRELQMTALATATRATELPTIVGGDTNLPGLSRIFARSLGHFDDGFAEVGRGLGHTYPSARPWMRIDRVLARRPLAFDRFEVLPFPHGSDHLPVLAVISRR